VSPEAFNAHGDPSGGPEHATDVALRLRHALATIDRMPPRVRVAFEAYTIGGESMDAIALRVGRPLSSLAKDIARGRAMLDRATARNRGTVGHVLRARRPGAAARRDTLRGRLASVRGALATALRSLDLAMDALAGEGRA